MAIFHRLKSWFAAKPPVEFRHPEFGVLTLDSPGGLWTGYAQREGSSIRFYIGGTDTEPDAGLLDRVQEVVGRFPEVDGTALDFLGAQDASVRQGEFEFYSLNFLWENKPHIFALEFTLVGDDDGIWNVEHDSGHPIFVGRDD